jgi:hypothetical protein
LGEMMRKLIVVTACAALGAACAASAAERVPGRLAPATLPAPPEGQGQLLFWRSGTVVGKGMGCGVNIGNERISALGAGRYFILPLPAGEYEFNAKSEAKDVLSVAVKPGETTYVKCTIKMGVMVGRPNLSPSTAEEYAAKRGDLKYVDSDDIGPKVLADPAPVAEPTG